MEAGVYITPWGREIWNVRIVVLVSLYTNIARDGGCRHTSVEAVSVDLMTEGTARVESLLHSGNGRRQLGACAAQHSTDPK